MTILLMAGTGPAVAGSGGPGVSTPPDVDPNAITQPPLGNEPGWIQKVREGFDIDVAPESLEFRTKYPAMTTIRDISATNGAGDYRDQIISVSGSELCLDIGWDEASQTYRGAYLLPRRYVDTLYGRYDFRIRMPTFVRGWKMASLLWSNDNDWNKGEVDFYETGALGAGVKFFTHVVGNAADNAYGNESVKVPGTNTPISTTNYSTGSLRWTPTEISAWYNGQKADSTTDQRGFPKTPMRWGIQFEFSSLNKNVPPAKTARGKVYFDWICTYEYDAATAA